MGLSALVLLGCLSKDRTNATLGSDGLTPPWDSTHFAAKQLVGYMGQASDSQFSIFKTITNIDSQLSVQKKWDADPDAIDTVKGSQIFDTSFVYPLNSVATMAFGYDDSFRDDTLFRYDYGNGLFTQDNPCAKTTILSGQFLHPARWLRSGLKSEEIISALGTPLYNQGKVLRYLSQHLEKAPTDSIPTKIFEAVNFYFQEDSLFAAVIQHSQPCH